MAKGLDIIIVNAGGFRKRAYQSLSEDYSAVEPPFWAALTAGYMRKAGFGADIIDANAEDLSFEETARRIEEKNPYLVNITAAGQHPSASTQSMPSIRELCHEIKKINPNRNIALTGLHPSALPERTMSEEECDFVCEGEGFYTLEGILKNKAMFEIPGLWYRGAVDKGIFHTDRAKNIADLTSELSEVAWDLLPMDKYKAHNWHCLDDLESRKQYASISTSLGCPFKCEFCAINSIFGERGMRCWKPEWALKQIDTLVKKYNVKNIKLIDELFVLNPNHFMPILEGIIKKDYKLNIWAYARVDTVKKDYLSKLKKAGVNWLALGIESGDKRVIESVSKGRFEGEKVKEIVSMIKNEGINVIGNYMFGLPEDSMESMQKTLDLALELQCEFANMYCAIAFPGSKLYDQAIADRTKLPDSWSGYAPLAYDHLPLASKYCTAEEILRFRDNAFNIYFANHAYLNMIEKKFGLKAREHVENMTQSKIKRKILGD